MPYRTASRRPLLAVLALAILASMATVGSAEAQFLPAIVYGGGLKTGQKVEAFIDGKACASTTASARGEWVMQIVVDAPCAPKPGAAITFKVDGASATSSPEATWQSGGIPTGSVKSGYTLTFGAGSGSTDSTSEDGEGGGSNAALFVGIGVVLIAAVGGAGWFMYRRRPAA